MDYADKLDMMDDDCDIQGFSLYDEPDADKSKAPAPGATGTRAHTPGRRMKSNNN